MAMSMRSLFVAALVLAPVGAASEQVFTTTMTPGQVVPPTSSTAFGTGTFRLDDRGVLSFEVTVEDLHGGETQASIHGPAPAGSNASVIFGLPLGSTKVGALGPLTATQMGELRAGSWYVVIHSTHHGNGEIRGQIASAVAVGTSTWSAVKARYRVR